MRMHILKTIKNKEPFVTMTCENVDVAKRFLKHKFETLNINKGNKKKWCLTNEGKKLVIGDHTYEAVPFNFFQQK